VDLRTVELLEKEKELERKSRYLEEANTALKVLLGQREKDTREVQEAFLCNVKDLILPLWKGYGMRRGTDTEFLSGHHGEKPGGRHYAFRQPVEETGNPPDTPGNAGGQSDKTGSFHEDDRFAAPPVHEDGGLPPREHPEKARHPEQEGQPQDPARRPELNGALPGGTAARGERRGGAKKKGPVSITGPCCLPGGAEGSRTPGLLNAILLSDASHNIR
jgi:hypothetical protein